MENDCSLVRVSFWSDEHITELDNGDGWKIFFNVLKCRRVIFLAKRLNKGTNKSSRKFQVPLNNNVTGC